MILYFLRHAHAEDGEGKPDEQRALSERGLQQAADTADLLKRLDVDLEFLFTSPRLRAMQTAEAISKALDIKADTREELNYGFNTARLSSMLGDVTPHDSVMLVGHEPTFSQTIQALTGARVEMKKCGLARIDVLVRQPLQGELTWLLTPKLVRALNGE